MRLTEPQRVASIASCKVNAAVPCCTGYRRPCWRARATPGQPRDGPTRVPACVAQPGDATSSDSGYVQGIDSCVQQLSLQIRPLQTQLSGTIQKHIDASQKSTPRDRGGSRILASAPLYAGHQGPPFDRRMQLLFFITTSAAAVPLR